MRNSRFSSEKSETLSDLLHHVADRCGSYRCVDCRYIRQGGTWEVRYSVGYTIVIIQNGRDRYIMKRTAVVVIGVMTADISGREVLAR